MKSQEEPVKQGHWEKDSQFYECSECHKWLDVLQGTAEMNYCPHCGVKIEGPK